MYEIQTEIEIEADAPEVWNVLTAFDEYPEWNPFVRRIEGALAVGEQLSVQLDQAGGKPMGLKPRVVFVEDGSKFGWLGKLLLPKIFDGTHSFEIQPLSEGRTLFKHYEHFSGVLVPLFRGMFENKTRPAFEAMNRALKQRVERASA